MRGPGPSTPLLLLRRNAAAAGSPPSLIWGPLGSARRGDIERAACLRRRRRAYSSCATILSFLAALNFTCAERER